MGTAITIVVFGIVGISAVICVMALIHVSGPSSTPTKRPGNATRESQPPSVHDDEAWAEAQALVAVRNARRRRHGEPESDADREAAELLRELGDDQSWS